MVWDRGQLFRLPNPFSGHRYFDVEGTVAQRRGPGTRAGWVDLGLSLLLG